MSKKTFYTFMISMLIAFLIPTGTAQANGQPVFRIEASASSIKSNEQVTVRVHASGLSDVNAYEVKLRVESIGNGGAASLTLKSQQNQLPREGFTASAKTNNEFTFAYAIKGNQKGFGGNSDLSTFAFTGTGDGKVRVTLESVKLLDSNLAATTHRVGQSVIFGIGDASKPQPESKVVVVTVPGVPDAAGKVNVTVPSEQLANALSQAKGGTTKIKVETSGTISAVTVELPIKPLRDADLVKRIEIDTGLASISFDPKLARGDEAEGAANLRFSVSQADISKLTEDVRKLIGQHAVYDFSLSMDDKTISPLGDGKPVTLSVPYTLQSGENPAKVVVYYINNDGELEVVKNGKFDPSTGRITFKPKHFSVYAFVHAQATFKDLAGVSWAQDGIEALAVREIVNGVGDGRFEPKRNVTRAEFVQMLMGMLDLVDKQEASTFRDVDQGAWYYKAIRTAEALGVVNGRADGSFGVRDEINRQEMTVMIDRAARLIGLSLTSNAATQAEGQQKPFADQAEIAPYAVQAISSLHAAGMLQGMGGGRIAPNDPATRAQAAVLLYRIYLKIQ